MSWNRSARIACVWLALCAASVAAQPTIKTQSGGAVAAVCAGGTNGGDTTLNFDNVAAGDITVLYGGRGNSSDAQAFGPVTAGYIAIATIDSTGPKFGVWYKVQGGSPDASVVGEGGGGTAHGRVYCAYVLDGATVDAALFDAAATSTGQVAAVPNCAAITTVTPDAMVACHSAVNNVDTSVGTVSGYTSFIASGTAGNDSDDITIAAAHFTDSSPSVNDPAAWSTWTSGTGGSITVAWKAVPPPAAGGCHRLLLGVGC